MTRKERNEEGDIEKIFEQSFADWDAQRTEGLDDLLIFQQSKTESDERNFKRLRLKHGANNLLTLEAEAKIETNKIFVGELKREIVRTNTPQPEATADLWTIHGYVFDTENDTVPYAPVGLFDAQEGGIPRTETAKTDDSGYFRLRIENIRNLPKSVRVGVPPNHLSEAVFTPQIGETDYAEIFVTDEIRKRKPHYKPSGEKIPTGTDFSDWMVTGKVTYTKGSGVANLKVRVFNKVSIRDDSLGEAETNADGVYKVTFPKKKFSDSGENNPELYLVVEDKAGRKLFDGKRKAKGKAGRIELIGIRLKEYANKTKKPERKKQ